MATAESIAARLRELEPLDGEVWRPVAGFEDCCHVSNMGRIKALARKVPIWNGERQIPEAIKGQHLMHNGYMRFCFQRNRVTKRKLTHALVLETFVGQAPAGCETRHLNGVRHDNRLDNLAWGSKLENMRDQYRHGTRIRGATNAASKLTPAMVDLILTSGLTGVELSKRLGIGTATVCRVRKGKAKATLLGDSLSA